jgi:5-methylthioadenosine/S-adenosylhomocysteine deaminase
LKRTLVRGGTLVGLGTDGKKAADGDLLVEDGRIAAIGKEVARMLGEGPALARVLDARGCAVMPGLVQAHVHLCQVLFRGMADDMPLLDWLKKRIWPFEAAHDEASLRASAELGLLEMMLAGTTTILDMGTVHHYDAVLDACERAGIRVCGGKTMMDAATRGRSASRDAFATPTRRASSSRAPRSSSAKRSHTRKRRSHFSIVMSRSTRTSALRSARRSATTT